MSNFLENTLPETLDRIDQLIETAYFVPLSIKDALALQFRAPVLKDLPVETIRAVFNLIDGINEELDADPASDPGNPSHIFFQRLQNEMPELYAVWLKADDQLVLDPIGSLNHIVRQVEDLIEEWIAKEPDKIDHAIMERERLSGLTHILNEFDPFRTPDCAALRRRLRQEYLASLPVFCRPGVYLDCWLEFVKAVMDLSPQAVMSAQFPY